MEGTEDESPRTTRRTFMKAAAGAAAMAAPVGREALSATGREKAPNAGKRFLGITVLPEYIQSETVDGVLDNLINVVGATAVATSPYLMEEADRETGLREPPDDAGKGDKRLLDRPLFGKREVWVRTAPSFVPDLKLYRGLRYQPASPGDLTRREGPIVKRFVEEARKRGLKVYFQIQAAIPPCYRVQFGGPIPEDLPSLPNGHTPDRRVSKNGSLASEHILEYEHALIRDLFQQYPEIDGIRFDWPEYPPYFLDSVFVDFGQHAERAARRLGFDFQGMRRDVGGLYEKLHGGLTDRDLEGWLRKDGGRYHLLRFLSDRPGIDEWIRFKAVLVEQMLMGFRKAMDESGGKEKEMMPNAFPPPWTVVSGMDFRRVGKLSTAISCKLYSMHWAMILNNYGGQILAANPGLSEKLLTRVLVRFLDIADDDGFERLEDYHYPTPEEPHPVGSRAMARKIVQAQADAGSTPIYSLAHGYGPLEDFHRRLQVAWDASEHGLWMNRYAYLTDEKLRLIGQVARG